MTVRSRHPRERGGLHEDVTRALSVGESRQTHIYGNMENHMKTTIDVPDELFVAAKKRAAEERRPLRDVIAEGLRAQLQESRRRTGASRPIAWVTVKGGLPKGVDVSNRDAMHDALRTRP
jgi:hypothetical protein